MSLSSNCCVELKLLGEELLMKVKRINVYSRTCRVLFFLVFTSCFSAVFSQELPQIFRASPEAESLGKYGQVPVNLSSGRINYTVPIYDIKIGDFTYPLYLSYNYGGFQPTSNPSMVGVGWTANFSGVITRQVNGLPDSDGPAGYFFNAANFQNYENLSFEAKAYMCDMVADGFWDSRPDRYIINTNLINGNFRFNGSKKAIFEELRNYVVTPTFNYNLSKIDVLSDDGSLYEFHTTESTTNWTWGVDEEEKEHVSSCFLSRLVLPSGKGELKFDYKSYFFTNGQRSFSLNHTQCNNFESTTKTSNRITSQYDIYGKIIKRIDFPGGFILFETSQHPNFSPMLNAITVYSIESENGKFKERFEFEYYNGDERYFFLKSIKKRGGNNSLEDYYSFEYLDLDGVPKPVFYDPHNSQNEFNGQTDLWGYYNGRKVDLFNKDYTLGAVFNKNRIGALSKITYPTKGTTTIEYEPHIIGEYVPENKQDDFQSVSISSDTANDSCDERILAITDMNASYTATITLEVDVTADDSYADIYVRNELGGVLSGKNLDTGRYEPMSIVSRHSSSGSNRITRTYHASGSNFYKLVVGVCEAGNGLGTHSAKASISYKNNSSPLSTKKSDLVIGGIRVSKTIDCPYENTNNCITKNIKYEDGLKGGILADRSPRYRSRRIYKPGAGCNVGSLITFTETYLPTALQTKGNHINYPKVEVFINNGELGKEINYYSVVNNSRPDPKFNNIDKLLNVPGSIFFPDIYEDFGFKSNLLFRTEEYKKQDLINPVNLVVNSYPTNEKVYNHSDFAYDFNVFRRYVYPSNSTSLGLDNNGNVVNYYLSQFERYGLKHRTKSYLPNVKTTIQNLEGSPPVQSVEEYKYHPELGYKSEVSSVTSNNTKTKIIYKYPNDVTSITSLNGGALEIEGKLAIDKLKRPMVSDITRENRVSTLVQTETTLEDINGNVLSKSIHRTNYRTWSNGHTLPEFVQTSKGENILEDRIVYNDYYDNGNIREVSKKNGSPIVYIWGYKEQYPIVKIENATFSEIPSALYNSIISASNADKDKDTEEALRLELNKLRDASIAPSLTDSMITTYTYDPLIGVTSITDPRGETIYYDYDDFGRLKYVKDADDHILSENEYNYKQ